MDTGSLKWEIIPESRVGTRSIALFELSNTVVPRGTSNGTERLLERNSGVSFVVGRTEAQPRIRSAWTGQRPVYT